MTESDPRAAARRWLGGDYRTWRWNEGTYEGKHRYEAVETTATGLCWFVWDASAAGSEQRRMQSYSDFHADGPLGQPPPEVLEALREWIRRHPQDSTTV